VPGNAVYPNFGRQADQAGAAAALNNPVLERLPYRSDSRAYYATLRDLPWPVWLDSGFPESGSGRYDIIAADPYLTLVARNGVTTVSEKNGVPPKISRGDPLTLLRELIGEPTPSVAGLPFSGGAIGYLGYDLARTYDLLPRRAGGGAWPDAALGLYDWAVVIDHTQQRSYFVRRGRDPRQSTRWRTILRRLRTVGTPAPVQTTAHCRMEEHGMGYATYMRRFDLINHYIRDGDCYQVNFAQRFHATTSFDTWTLYQQVRCDNPAPYGALLEYPFGQILCSSPERFLGLNHGLVESRPIKGTRPRGDSAADDMTLRAELLSSDKDRAENLMIVDLIRNDLGKVCEPGSIDVPGLFQVESFATVHHLVSTVRGRLRPDQNAIDLIRACFPGGSITGTPKRRAMQIIEEVEQERREVYCGSVMWLGFDGNMDSNITIRTLLKRDRDIFYWAGGGIVADSDCAAEFQESLDKAAAFLRLFRD